MGMRLRVENAEGYLYGYPGSGGFTRTFDFNSYITWVEWVGEMDTEV